MCERGGCQGSSQRLAHASFSLGVGSAWLSHWTHAIKPQTLSNYGWSGETMEVSASVTFPGQIGSSIFVGILHWAKSTDGFTLSRCRQTPTGSSPEAGPQDLSLLWSYNYVSLLLLWLWKCPCFCCDLVSVQWPYISVSLALPSLCDGGHVCPLATRKLLQIYLPSPRGTDCQELDSKDFLTDPAVYYTVSKFQKF